MPMKSQLLHSMSFDIAWKLHELTPFAIELMSLDNDPAFAKEQEHELDEELRCRHS